MVKRKCYGYTVSPKGNLVINSEEANVVSWIFERYLAGVSLRQIAAGLERQGILSSTDRPRWNREAIISDKMFLAVQQEKFKRIKNPQNAIDMSFVL